MTESAALIEFDTTFEFQTLPWGVQLTPSSVMLAADDCPAEIEVLMTPPVGAPVGAMEITHVRARIGAVELGGVSVLDMIEPSVRSLSPGGLGMVALMLLGAGAIAIARFRVRAR